MDLRDLVKLAGIVNPEVLNKLEPTVEADGAGFEDATTRPQEEMMDDPMATMGSDVDLSLRRYLKAKGDHVTVDEEVYPDHTVESVTEAYAAFKAESATPNLDKEIAAYFKQIRTPAKGWGGKLKAEASIGAPDYNPAAGKYASNTVERIVLGAEDGGITISVDGKEVGYASEPKELAQLLGSMGVDSGTSIMHSSSVDFASEEGFESDGAAHELIDRAMEMLGMEESVEINEPEVDEGNAYSGALAKAKAAGADEFEVDGKVHKVKEASKPDYIDIDGDGDKEESMKKAAKDKEEDEEVDESLDILKKLAGL
jgi:hypothetical protein